MSWLRYFKVLVGADLASALRLRRGPRRCWRRAIPRRRHWRIDCVRRVGLKTAQRPIFSAPTISAGTC